MTIKYKITTKTRNLMENEFPRKITVPGILNLLNSEYFGGSRTGLDHDRKNTGLTLTRIKWFQKISGRLVTGIQCKTKKKLIISGGLWIPYSNLEVFNIQNVYCSGLNTVMERRIIYRDFYGLCQGFP